MSGSLPPYQVRVSKRARSIRLSVTREKGLMVTVPFGFNTGMLPGLISQKADWIQNAFDRLAQSGEVKRPKLPEAFDLQATGEKWTIVYKPVPKRSVAIESQSRHVLVISGKVGSTQLVKRLLHEWLRDQAQIILPSWLERVSRQIKLPYEGVTVRNQRTRWGSCSGQRTISLNQKLLFLPPVLVDYILIHELCHTVHMSHSRQFWKLVGQYIPDYAERRKALRDFEKKIPW
jgi:predicted metal-dependent hydrolase